MKLIDKIADMIGLYEEESYDDIDIEAENKTQPKKDTIKEVTRSEQPVQQSVVKPVRESLPKIGFHKSEAEESKASKKVVEVPVAQKQSKVIVIEPVTFDDSQKIADYLRNNQPVVVNFEDTDGVVTKRMTDFISGTIYALDGSMKKIGHNILVCAPKNVDINADGGIYGE